jgi:ArsR family transcriptional regulator
MAGKEAQDGMFRALADPTRRAILRALAAGPLSAGDLADRFDITKASMSHHFKQLADAGLVRRERRGQQIIYALNTSVVEDAARILLDIFPRRGRSR